MYLIMRLVNQVYVMEDPTRFSMAEAAVELARLRLENPGEVYDAFAVL